MDYLNEFMSSLTIDRVYKEGFPSGFVRPMDYTEIVLLDFFKRPVNIGNVISVDIIDYILCIKIRIGGNVNMFRSLP